MKKKHAIILLIVIVSFLLGCGLWAYLTLSKTYKEEHPAEPAYTGKFPNEPVWVFSCPENVTTSPVASGSLVFIRCVNSIYALNAESGTVQWTANWPGKQPLSMRPLVNERYLVVPGLDANIAVFDPLTGKKLWQSDTAAEGMAIQGDSSVNAFEIQGDYVFVTRYNFKLTTYRLSDGMIQWTVDVPHHTNLPLAVGPKTVYLGFGSELHTFDIETGIEGRYQLFQSSIGIMKFKSPVLYIGYFHGDSSLTALDPETMKVLWDLKYSETNEENPWFLDVYDDLVLMSGYQLTAVSTKTGKLLWSFKNDDYLERAVALDDFIYVRDLSTNLYVLEIASGAKTGEATIQANSSLQTSKERGPAVAGDLLLVPFGDARVYAFRP